MYKMRVLVFSILFTILVTVSSSLGKNVAGQQEGVKELNDDTIVVEAHDVEDVDQRLKRQVTPLLTVPVILRQQQPTGPRVGDSCLSLNGMPGSCSRLKQCYTFMQGNDLDDDGYYEGNEELAKMLFDGAGKCELPTTSPPAAIAVARDDFGEAESYPFPEEDLVCCTGNVSDVTFEPTAVKFIGGGSQARIGQFPAIVALMNRGRQFCGGSLIDSSHVLTAAHCVAHMDGPAVAALSVQIGDHDIYSSSDVVHQVRKVKRVIKHKGFSSVTLYNDVAILTLSSPVTFSSRVQQIGLGSASPSATAQVAGWGSFREGGTAPSYLQVASVTILTNQRCGQLYAGKAPGGIVESMVCAGSLNSADACQGDSGGPLIIGGKQVGIVSWGIGCGRYPGVYTRVTSFLPWIQKNIKL